MKLFTIIQKNFRIFTRSRISALIIFLGPLLLVSLIGLSFSNTQVPGLTVGTYSPSYNDFTNSIISKIKDNNFEINKFDSKELCSNSVKKGDSAICLVFPENMDKTNNEVTFVVDYSKINLVFMVVDIFNTRVGERTNELRTNYATDLIGKVTQTRDDLNKQKANVAALTTKQTEASDTLKQASSSLGEINPDTNLNEIDTTVIKSTLANVGSGIDSAKSKITDAEASVGSSSLSQDEKDAINEKLLSAKSELSSTSLYIEGNASAKSLEYMVLSLDSALSSAKAQLEDIKKQKDSVNGNLVTLQGSISDSINAVDSLSNSLSDMISRIESVQTSDASQLVSPIKTKIEPVTTPETHFNYLFPTLIVMIIMITSVLLSSTLVMNEKKSKSLFRNFITPTSEIIFNLGTFLTSFLAILIQLVIFLFISSLFFGTDVLSSILNSSLIFVLITSAFILLGMVIGYAFKSEETYVLAAITVSSLLLFLSSTVMPIESISNSVRMFASFTPFVVSENLLRQVMFFNFGLVDVLPQLAILIGYIVVFAGVIIGLHKLARYHITFQKKAVKKDVKK